MTGWFSRSPRYRIGLRQARRQRRAFSSKARIAVTAAATADTFPGSFFTNRSCAIGQAVAGVLLRLLLALLVLRGREAAGNPAGIRPRHRLEARRYRANASPGPGRLLQRDEKSLRQRR